MPDNNVKVTFFKSGTIFIERWYLVGKNKFRKVFYTVDSPPDKQGELNEKAFVNLKKEPRA